MKVSETFEKRFRNDEGIRWNVTGLYCFMLSFRNSLKAVMLFASTSSWAAFVLKLRRINGQRHRTGTLIKDDAQSVEGQDNVAEVIIGDFCENVSKT
jgi:hypothetical protein